MLTKDTGSLHFADRQLSLLTTVLGGDSDEDTMHAGIAFVGGQKPKDEIEAALAVQMLGAHEASMRLLATAMAAKHIDHVERCINMATKLQRTFTAQVEAMKRYRSSGEQTIRVRHQSVTVQDGGQAVVGDVHHGGGRKGVKAETGDNPIDRLAAARIATRCTATAKRSSFQCLAPAVRGWKVCHCHGARGGAPQGELNGLYRHGLYTGGAIATRRDVRALFAAARELLAQV